MAADVSVPSVVLGDSYDGVERREESRKRRAERLERERQHPSLPTPVLVYSGTARVTKGGERESSSWQARTAHGKAAAPVPGRQRQARVARVTQDGNGASGKWEGEGMRHEHLIQPKQPLSLSSSPGAVRLPSGHSRPGPCCCPCPASVHQCIPGPPRRNATCRGHIIRTRPQREPWCIAIISRLPARAFLGEPRGARRSHVPLSVCMGMGTQGCGCAWHCLHGAVVGPCPGLRHKAGLQRVDNDKADDCFLPPSVARRQRRQHAVCVSWGRSRTFRW